MILLAALPAFADAIAAPDMCAMAGITQTVPRSAQTAVPVDVRLAAVMFADCGGPTSVTLSLTTADGAPVAAESIPWSGERYQLFELYPDAELLPDTAYVLTVTPDDGSGELTEIGFTTGSGHVAGIDGSPSYTLEDLRADKGSGVTVSDGTVTAAADPDDLSILVLESSGVASGTVMIAPDEAGSRSDAWQGEARGELCVTVTQLDGSGAAVAAEPVCDDVVPQGLGCMRGGGVSMAGVLLALGLLRRR